MLLTASVAYIRGASDSGATSTPCFRRSGMPERNRVVYFHPLVHGGLDGIEHAQQPEESILSRLASQLSVICLAELGGWSSGASTTSHADFTLRLHTLTSPLVNTAWLQYKALLSIAVTHDQIATRIM